jgi:hypothetical protein
MRSWILTPVLGVVLVATALSQDRGVQFQAPPRDRPPATGTAAIKGRVTDGASGTGLARARVRLSGPAGQRPSAITDAGGHFAFTDLPAGPYGLTVEKATYLPGRYPETGRSLRNQGRPVILHDGQLIDDVTIPLYRGGALTGRVLDQHGDPVEHASIQVLRASRMSGVRPAATGGASTNDLGEFRVARLQPGTYFLVAMPRGRGGPDVDESQPVPTYYPGVAAIDQAFPLTVERGQTLSGLDVMMIEGTTSTVSGVVVNAEDEPIRSAFVNAQTVLKDLHGGWTAGGASTKPDGSFQLRLTQGEYQLHVNARVGESGGPTRPEDEQYGTTRLTVAGDPLAGLKIVVGRLATVSGRIVFDGTSPIPANPEHFRVSFSSQDGTMCRSGRSETAGDWTFTVTGVAGTCTAAPGGPMGRWTPKAVIHDGVDLLDRPIEFEPGRQLRDVQVVLTDRRTELTFKVSDEGGQSTREYVALVFPTDKARWSAGWRYVRSYVPVPPELMAFGGGQGSRGRSGTPMPGGPMRPEMLTGLPPGDYFAVALPDIDPEDTRDPAVLERLARHAERITLAEGTRVEAVLRIVTKY